MEAKDLSADFRLVRTSLWRGFFVAFLTLVTSAQARTNDEDAAFESVELFLGGCAGFKDGSLSAKILSQTSRLNEISSPEISQKFFHEADGGRVWQYTGRFTGYLFMVSKREPICTLLVQNADLETLEKIFVSTVSKFSDTFRVDKLKDETKFTPFGNERFLSFNLITLNSEGSGINLTLITGKRPAEPQALLQYAVKGHKTSH